MAYNKNQHYVPRVYLNPFTLDKNGLAINLLNIDGMKHVNNAPAKNQCSADYFYGKDFKLESAISSAESPYGEIVRLLMRNENTITAKVRLVILRFSYLQHLRTEAAARKMAEMVSIAQKVPGSNLANFNMRDAIKAAVQMAMLHYAERMAIVDDLKVCILRNCTDQPFFTSDDPSVLTNRLLIQRHYKLSCSFGVKTAGAIFVLPICSYLCAIMYDPAVYQTSNTNG